MIPMLPGWTTMHEGPTSLLCPPGQGGGAIRYDERCAPIRPLAELVARREAERAQAGGAPFVPSAPAVVEELLTDEGEHATLVIIDGTIEGVVVSRVFAFVFADETYARLTAVTLPEMRATIVAAVRQLARGASHMLGVRRRRYRYARPEGWTGNTVGYQTNFTSPNRRAAIAVFPATPLAPDLHAQAERLLSSEAPGARRRPLITASGLAGEIWDLARAGGDRRRLVVLTDDRFLYAARLDIAADADETTARRAFDALVASIEPIPRPAGATLPTMTMQVMQHWAG